MSGWWEVGVTCPRCEVPVEPLAIGKPTDYGTRAMSTAQCPDCRRQFSLVIELRALSGQPAVPL